MKTKKLKSGKYLFLSILVLPLLFTSCEDDFKGFDLRDELVGFYDYEIKAYIDTGEELVYIGDEPGHYDITGTALVSKNPEYNDMIEFWDGSELLFEGEKIRENNNTISFDIPLQEFWAGPVPVIIEGYDYWNVDDVPYHGAYIYDNESMEIGFAARVMDVGSDLVMIFDAWKQ